MRHVLVETSWVVDLLAPAHHRMQPAAELLERAARGEVRLHLPAICIAEARRVLGRPRFQPRAEADAIRVYIRWATREDTLARAEADAALRVVNAMEKKLRADQEKLPGKLAALPSLPGVEVFGLTDAMLERSIELATADLALRPFDQSILAAVLVRGAELAQRRPSEVCFVTLDRHLRPWDKQRNRRVPLADWYDRAQIRVYADFALTTPARPKAPPSPAAGGAS